MCQFTSRCDERTYTTRVSVCVQMIMVDSEVGLLGVEYGGELTASLSAVVQCTSQTLLRFSLRSGDILKSQNVPCSSKLRQVTWKISGAISTSISTFTVYRLCIYSGILWWLHAKRLGTNGRRAGQQRHVCRLFQTLQKRIFGELGRLETQRSIGWKFSNDILPRHTKPQSYVPDSTTKQCHN